jgi:hypothetical protein
MLMVDDYAYTILDFPGDPYLSLLKDAQWGDLGKYTFFYFKCFCDFYHIKCFYVCPRTDQKSLFDDTDVGPYRPPGTYPIQR